MQSQRLRMVSDSELRMEQFQAERKDEKRRYEDALERLKQVLLTALQRFALLWLPAMQIPTNNWWYAWARIFQELLCNQCNRDLAQDKLVPPFCWETKAATTFSSPRFS